MAAKRNATGLALASDLQRKSLNDEELVRRWNAASSCQLRPTCSDVLVCFICRNSMCTRRPYKLWFTPFRVQRHTISFCGLQHLQHIATNAKDSSGELHGKEFAAMNAESNAMKNAKICSMRIAFNVSFWDIKRWQAKKHDLLFISTIRYFKV